MPPNTKRDRRAGNKGKRFSLWGLPGLDKLVETQEKPGQFGTGYDLCWLAQSSAPELLTLRAV